MLVKDIECPVLILAGDMENQIPLNETQKIYDNCGSTQKKLHIFHTGSMKTFIVDSNLNMKQCYPSF